MEPHIVRLGPSQNDADAIADLHTRSRQIAYRGLYGDAYLDRELFDAARAVWRERFATFDPSTDLILAAMDGDTPIGLAYASFRINPQVGLLLDNLHVAPERKGGGPLMFIDAATAPSVDELLQGLVVDSGNDASVALAEAVGGSVEGFVGMMNRQAQAWGLKNTVFRNVTGLAEPGHRSTPRDMAVVAQHIIRDFPEYYHYYSQRDYTSTHVHQAPRNLLLKRDPSVDGMKHGFTDAAGYCLLASAQREFPNGRRRLMAIVMGADSAQGRANETQKLLNWGFTAFDDVRLAEAGKAIIAPVPVWKGTQAEVGLGSADAIYVAVPKGEGEHLKTLVERTDPLVAPLAKGQRVGSLKVTTASGTAIATIALTVLEEVPQAGPFGRAWDAIRLWIK